MNSKVLTIIALISASALIGISISQRFFSADPANIVITSDIHISNPQGRWPHTTQSFADLLGSLENKPEFVFIAGDFVDNVIQTETGFRAGTLEYWKSEVTLYQSLSDQSGIEFLHTYGPGHDFIGEVKIKTAEEFTGIPRRGIRKWGDIDLIWVTVFPASFDGSANNPAALLDEDYLWLDQQLSESENAILISHVPIRTADTFQHGLWSGNLNLSIPYHDKIYPLLDKHHSRIAAVFGGHIHTPVKSDYNGIPMYICPAFGSGCYCELQQSKNQLDILPKNCGLEKLEIALTGADR